MNSLELNVVPGSTPIITQNLQDIGTQNTPTGNTNRESMKTGVNVEPYSHQSMPKALNGQGTTISSDGSKYIGEFKDGKYHGQGHLCVGDQKFSHDEYVGEFSEGKFEGKGFYTKSDGGKYDGEWKDNQYWTGREYCREGKLVGRFLKGKRQPLKNRKIRKPAPVVSVFRDKFDADRFEKGKKQSICEWKAEMRDQKHQVLERNFK